MAVYLAAGCCACAAWFGASASAHSGVGSGNGYRIVAGSRGRVGPAVREVVGETARRTRSGIFRVTLANGSRLFTHGPDPVPAAAETGLDGHGGSLQPGDPERAPVCASDYYQRILYAYPAGGTDNLAAVAANLRAAIGRIDAVLNEAAQASSSNTITADYKVLCDGAGAIRIDAFAVSGSSFSDHVDSAQAVGYLDPSVDYTIFSEIDDPSVCGVGSWYPDDTLDADNPSNNPVGAEPGYAVIYADCWYGGRYGDA